MTVLWAALGIYIVGVACVLYMRPGIMFRESGWKEFGLSNTHAYTVFPFWLFAVVWAILAYTLATMGAIFVASTIRQSGYYILENSSSASSAPTYSYFGPNPPTTRNL